MSGTQHSSSRPHRTGIRRARRFVPPWAVPVGVFVTLTVLLVLRILSVPIPTWLWWTIVAAVGFVFIAGAIEWIVLRRKRSHGGS